MAASRGFQLLATNLVAASREAALTCFPRLFHSSPACRRAIDSADQPGAAPSGDDAIGRNTYVDAFKDTPGTVLGKEGGEPSNVPRSNTPEARSFRAFVRAAAPYLGCSTSGLEHSHDSAYPPLPAGQDLYPSDVWGDNALEVRLMDYYRRSNLTMPCQDHQRVYGRVVGVSDLKVFVDAGAGQLTQFFKRELSLADVVDTKVPLDVRRSTHDILVGDRFVFNIESTRSPFGGLWLMPARTTPASRLNAVWNEIVEAYTGSRPIKGRILNPVNGGYSVGVGGFVGFMPFSMVSPQFARRVGLLQNMYIESVRYNPRTFVVIEPQAFGLRQRRSLGDPRPRGPLPPRGAYPPRDPYKSR